MERGAGALRVHLDLARRGAAGHRARPDGRVPRARPALSPRDLRARDGHGRARCSPGGCRGSRSAAGRRSTSTSPATPGRRRPSRMHGCASASTSCARCGAGEEVTHAGSSRSTGAALVAPGGAAALVGGAMSAETAAWAARLGRRAAHREPARRHARAGLAAYRDAGGRGACGLQVHLSVRGGPTTRRCDRGLEQWRGNCLPTLLAWDLETPEQFEAATAHLPREEVAANVYVSGDVDRHAAVAAASTWSSASRSSTCTTSGQTTGRVHRRVSAPAVLPALRGTGSAR